jgi:hypothetical protein
MPVSEKQDVAPIRKQKLFDVLVQVKQIETQIEAANMLSLPNLAKLQARYMRQALALIVLELYDNEQ